MSDPILDRLDHREKLRSDNSAEGIQAYHAALVRDAPLLERALRAALVQVPAGHRSYCLRHPDQWRGSTGGSEECTCGADALAAVREELEER